MTNDAKNNLLEQGYIKFEQLLSVKDIDELRLLSEAVLYRTSCNHRERYKSNGSLCNLAELPEYANLISDPRLLEALQRVGAEDIR